MAHHVRPAVGALDPEDVVLGDEGIRVFGAGRTTSSQSTCPGQEPRRSAPSGRSTAPGATPFRLPAALAQPSGSGPPPGLFLRLCFSSIYKKGIMKWPDWRETVSGKGKGREASNL